MFLRRLCTALNSLSVQTASSRIFAAHPVLNVTPKLQQNVQRSLVCLRYPATPISANRGILQYKLADKPARIQQKRTRVYYSWKQAKPATVHAVVDRFKRLGCGLWIRTRAGRRKKLWKKSSAARRRARLHVVCNKKQSWLLDRMVCGYWKRHRHYPDDPYKPYHIRNGLEHIKVYHKAPFYP